ncbi:unnamed protein product [Spirodela intermedia]|uniref:protein-serine/threonine phosphatase n=1 Tax=Spirodela intermedia TaxID=51605 RepID=A0A7I8J984_SPIIN|nr:unnamed protein product [Spirodela intermedia]CAA6666012.1 unnamed protein product [Spirodela intermedia]
MGSSCSRCCAGQAPDSPRDTKLKESENARATSGASVSPVSSSEQGDPEEQFQRSNFPRDSSIGINRLSRVSSQFLPPDGSRTVKVPAGNFDLQYSYLSQRGYYPEALDKANQDSFCIHTPFGTSPDDHFFGVFDGHGEFGAQCSQFAKRKLCENLLRNSRFRTDPVEACHAAFLATNSQLHTDGLDDSMSGTTAVTVLVRGRTIYVANCGDSRAVIAETRGKDIVAVDLSVDQTPFRTDELERVKNCGARVLTLDQIEGLKNPDVQCWGTEEGDDGDPPRVWVQNGMYPGTAFTRSIGDSIAESIGVVAMPEIVVLELTQNHPFFVIASDGVFEFLSSETVVDMVSKFKDPRDACAAIVAESYRLWLQYETRTDDITIIVVHINGLIGTASVQGPSNSLRTLPQVIEVTGSESPSTLNWNSSNQRVRQDLSRARLRAIEILHDHFLFRKLTDSQSRVLLDCMQRIEVKPGDIVVQQGGEGDCFYVVGSGEFEVLATQCLIGYTDFLNFRREGGKEVIRVLHKYTSEKLSSFGELALMYNKPLQASVRAVTSGTLWALKREDFREFSRPSFPTYLLQLKNISDILEEVSFSDGHPISQYLSALHIILKGQVRMTYDDQTLRSPNVRSLPSPNITQEDHAHRNSVHEVLFSEGSHFGDWTLLGEKIGSLIITKEKFDSAIEPLPNLPPDDQKLKNSLVSLKGAITDDATRLSKIRLSDLKAIHATDYSDLGIVLWKDSSRRVSDFEKIFKEEDQAAWKRKSRSQERDLLKSLSHSAHVPRVLCTLADQSYLAILLSACLSCSLSSILYKPLDEPTARFCAASVVVALEELHETSTLYRGVSPEILMLDRRGHLQLVDFRFAKKLAGERTFTICGTADSLSPEILQGKGHGLAADWWALGVLIHFMLQAEMPFGSWRESELETFSKIARGVCRRDERLGSDGAESVKKHPWFSGLDWKGFADCTVPVPQEITSRIDYYLENRAEGAKTPTISSPSPEADEAGRRSGSKIGEASKRIS